MSGAPRTFDDIRLALAERRVSVRALVDRALAEAARGAPEAWISRLPAEPLHHQAAALDACLAAEGRAVFERLPLFGLVFAAKDNIDVAGLPTTAACPGYATRAATANAPVVQRLLDAGAICLGKTNLDQFATGLVGTRSPYGAVPNPFDADRVSGGSSSGSAYVVSTGQVAFSLGTDTAGSGRVPAGFCNISGLKPTRGWLSARGVLPACRSLDCVSVFALTPEDAWDVARCAAAPDPLDPYSRAALPPLAPRARLDGLRLGVPEPLAFFGDALAEAAFAEALDRLRHAGVRLVAVPYAPFERTAALLYEGPWVAERYAAVGRFLAEAPAGADPTVAAIVASGAAPSAHALFAAQYELEATRRRVAALWSDVDAIVVPTAPTHPTRAALRDDPVTPNRQLGHYTNFVNLLDLAAHALPGPFRTDGLPAGVTLVGPAFSDLALARMASALLRILQPEVGAMRHRVGAAPVLAAPAPDDPLRLVAVGAHMAGLPLHWQLEERAARLVARTTTAPVYRLHSLTGARPTRPGLAHVGAAAGRSIEVEVWEIDARHLGSLMRLIAAPLVLGSVELSDGRAATGFLCEPRGVTGDPATLDITHFGGWRAFLAACDAGAPM